MLISNTSDNIVTYAQQEEWRKDQKRQKILPSRISTERNSSKHLDVQTQALTDNVEATCDILAPVINLLPKLDNDHKEEDVDSLVKMLPRSLQPNNDVLCAELTLFRNHCRENKLEIETIAEAARLAMKFESKFPLTNICYCLILTAPSRSFSKLKLIKTVVRLRPY